MGKFRKIKTGNINVRFRSKEYNSIAVLKLTVKDSYDEKKLSARQRKFVHELKEEAKENNFKIDIQ